MTQSEATPSNRMGPGMSPELRTTDSQIGIAIPERLARK